jgi:acetoacetate decarboxylase
MANRWVRQPGGRTAEGISAALPPIPSLEVVYHTDPAVLAEVLPPPLTPPAEPRVHVRISDIDLKSGDFHYSERVGFFAVDAVHDGQAGEYPLLIPIDLEPALAISRERNGEPKKLAHIELVREGNHVEGRITRNGVTFIEIVGDVTERLITPAPYRTSQFWYKFLPAVSGEGFDAGPFLVRMDQVRTPVTLEQVEGKFVLRDEPTCPVVDLPVLEVVSITWTTRSSVNNTYLVGPVDPVAFEPLSHSRYDH